MRYVVVTVADGEAGVFNKKLSAEAFEKFIDFQSPNAALQMQIY